MTDLVPFSLNPESVVNLRRFLMDLDGAINNFNAEHTGFNVEEAKTETVSHWSTYFDAYLLGVVQIENNESLPLIVSLLMLNLFSDVDCRYRGFIASFTMMIDHFIPRDFSLWDTYRSPSFIHPTLARNSIHALSLTQMSLVREWITAMAT